MSIDVTLPEDEPVIIMTRLLDAPIELVWEVFTTPEHMVHWWGGHGWSNPVCEIDLRVGGRRTQVMRSPEGMDIPMNGIFLEVEKPTRLVWRNEYADPSRPPVIQAAVLSEEGGKTRWTLTATMVSMESREAATRMGFAGFIGESMERLAGYLADRQR